jgi:alkaline phosphatase
MMVSDDVPTAPRDQSSFFTRLMRQKKFVCGGVALALLLTAIVVGLSVTTSRARGSPTDSAPTLGAPGTPAPPGIASATTVKNLVFGLSDGMGPASMTLARTVGGRDSLVLDALLSGTSRTRSSDSLVTDSAAGATAYASGAKSFNGAIGVDPKGLPLGTLLEVAQRRGMPVGLVCTSRMTHATPAAFSAHALFRDFEQFIASQQANLTIDVMLGGGRDKFAARPDMRNLLAELASRGVTVLNDAAEFRSFASDLASKDLRTVKVAGLFTGDHMSYSVDRKASEEPSLAEMTALALNVLSAKAGAAGFFLMVEGSRIDMAAHDNDASTQVGEVLAYDEAIGTVLEFIKREPDTLLVSTSDHETGGLSLGLRNVSLGAKVTYNWYPERLRAAKRSAFATSRLIATSDSAAIPSLVRDYVGADLSADEVQKYVDLKANGTSEFVMMLQLGNDQARRSLLGWSTTGHSGVDVNLYAAGRGAERFRGSLENTQVGQRMAEALGLWDDLLAHTEWLRANSTLDLTSGAAHMKRDVDLHHNHDEQL